MSFPLSLQRPGPAAGAAPGRAAALGFWLALLLIAAAELTTALLQPHLGLALHGALLAGLLAAAVRTRHPAVRNMALGLTLAPLVRLLSVGLPLAALPQLAWYPAVGAPLLIAAWLIIRQSGLGRRELGLRQGDLLWELALMAGGFTLGTIEYSILRPAPSFGPLTAQLFLLASISLVIFTGFTEELIFRGLLQATALATLGRWGLAYVSLLFALLHIGHLSLADLVFVLVVALGFGQIVRLQGSILGVSLAHGLTNLTMFVIMPALHRDRPDLIPAFIAGPLAVGTALSVGAAGLLAARSAERRIGAIPQHLEQLERQDARRALRALLRESRRERRLLFSDLAARTGITSGRLAEIEAGLARPSADEQRHLARELGIAAPTLSLAIETAARSEAALA